MQAGIPEHEPRAIEHSLLRAFRGGEHLAGEPLGAAIEHNVGERAAYIDRHADVVAVGFCEHERMFARGRGQAEARKGGTAAQTCRYSFRSSLAIRNSISAIASLDNF